MEIQKPLLVVDLEATCSDDGAIPREETEIIEIGAVVADGSTFAVIDEFDAYVRPVRHPVLTKFCTSLTGITQARVDGGRPFPEVLAEFVRWFGRHGDVRFCSWGDYDRGQIGRDCAAHNLPNPMPDDHLNLKRLFQTIHRMRRPIGMAEALKKCGLTLEGRHHNGLDDARNIARMLPTLMASSRSESHGTA